MRKSPPVLNASTPKEGGLRAKKYMKDRSEHPSKAPLPMILTVSGMIMVRREDCLKQPLPRTCMEPSNTTYSSFDPMKALSAMWVTDSGRVTEPTMLRGATRS